MFEAIYRIRIKQGALESYQAAWEVVAKHMMSQRGAVASRFYIASDDQDCIVHSRWPNRVMNQKGWPPSESDPEEVHAAASVMRDQRDDASSMHLQPAELREYLDTNNFRSMGEVVSSRKNILIYNDDGAGSSVYELQEMLTRVVDLSTIRILIVDAEYINTMPGWEERTRLFIMPGGRARPFYTALGAEWKSEEVAAGELRELSKLGVGNARIKNFVLDGGSYLGVCAGAYYAALRTVFEKGSSLEILDEGALCLFEGIAEGPAYGLGRFDYRSEQGAEVATLSSSSLLNGDGITSYFNGGCFFTAEGSDGLPEESILSEYANITASEGGGKSGQVAAIVESSKGKGKVILSGTHFQISSTVGSANIESSVIGELAGDDGRRLLLGAEIIDRLNVPLAEESYASIYAEQATDLELFENKVFSSAIALCNRITFPLIDSTQTYAKTHREKLKIGEWRSVIAEQQTAGRGTHGRTWKSPEGNIYATFSTLVPKERMKNNFTAIPQVAAFSIIQVLRTFGLNPTYKWVNDVLLNNKKVSGILCECEPVSNALTNEIDYYVLHIGVGVNISLSQAECETLSQPATSLNLALGRKVNKEVVLSLLEQSLVYYIEALLAKGYSLFRERLNALIAFVNTPIVFSLEDGKNTIIEGTLTGLNQDGALIIANSNGVEETYYSGRILKGNEVDSYRAALVQGGGGGSSHTPAFHQAALFVRKHFEVTESTQDYLRDNLSELFKGTAYVLITADEQTKGRGAQNHKWASPPDVNIYATFGVVLPSDREGVKEVSDQPPIATQIVALAVVKTLKQFGFAPSIKWRNDVRIGGKKISGILCELISNGLPTSTGSSQSVWLVGVGLNVNMEESICASLDQPVTSMAVERGENFDKEEVLNGLQMHLAGLIKRYFKEGPSAFQQEVQGHLEGVGQRISVEDELDKNIYTGEFLGIDEDGALILELVDTGDKRTINNGRILKESLVSAFSNSA
jgi:BirA family transcriptional regulator, biotin operon repressor / biotin---[acetyl-CoA-carboxylase] ligase